jgi:hypothetical protein
MTADSSPGSTTRTLAQLVLQSLVYARWIRTVVRDHLTYDISQEHLQGLRPTLLFMHHLPTGQVYQSIRTHDVHLLPLSPYPPKNLAATQVRTKLCLPAAPKRPEKGMPHVLRHLLLPFRPLEDLMSGGLLFLIVNQVLPQYHPRNLLRYILQHHHHHQQPPLQWLLRFLPLLLQYLPLPLRRRPAFRQAPRICRQPGQKQIGYRIEPMVIRSRRSPDQRLRDLCAWNLPQYHLPRFHLRSMMQQCQRLLLRSPRPPTRSRLLRLEMLHRGRPRHLLSRHLALHGHLHKDLHLSHGHHRQLLKRYFVRMHRHRSPGLPFRIMAQVILLLAWLLHL